MKPAELKKQVLMAVEAAHAKQAQNVAILELPEESSAFTDYFVVCSGNNPRQVQAICDEVEERLSKAGMEPNHREGYNQAEWVLLDYVDFVLHVFSENARKFYDLERLWKTAKALTEADLKVTRKPASKKATPPPAKKAATPKKTLAESRRRQNVSKENDRQEDKCGAKIGKIRGKGKSYEEGLTAEPWAAEHTARCSGTPGRNSRFAKVLHVDQDTAGTAKEPLPLNSWYLDGTSRFTGIRLAAFTARSQPHQQQKPDNSECGKNDEWHQFPPACRCSPKWPSLRM